MDGEDEALTPRKVLWRSASWSGRPVPPRAGSIPARPPRAGRPLLPLAVSRHHPPNEWPRPGSDDCLPQNHNPPATPSAATTYAADGECSRVSDHVFLGSDVVARDREALRRRGITHVLNCVGAACPDYFRSELNYKTLWLRDSPAEDITSVLYDAFDYLEDARAASGRVLVHCVRGASRSAAIVVAYLMWRHSLPFDDALRRVRTARAAADPNFGFAAQLLYCQRRILHTALPSSPAASALPRAYRMAPHSPYDPLHLVPKAVDAASSALDSRGAFLIHALSSTVFIWVGRACESSMADSAAAAAHQVIRYEGAHGPISTVCEGAETSDFWNALMDDPEAAADDCPRNVEMYDLDFEIFRRALRGGVLPPVPMSGRETHLPARESGWSRVREKFSVVKQLATSIVEEDSGEPFRSPCSSFSRESSTTPSAGSSSTFSPASTSSLDWDKYSPPGFNLQHIAPPPPPPPLPLSSLPPLHNGKGKGKDFFCSSTTLAERRGGKGPLILLPPIDDDKCQRDIVRDWCLSPTFTPQEEENKDTMTRAE